jgi:hypothetical protein
MIHLSQEGAGRCQDGFRLIAMGAMAAIRQFETL